MAREDWLGSYRDRASVDHTIRRIATRLSRNGDRLVACLDELRASEAEIARGFAPLLEDLVTHAEALRSRT